MKRAATVLAVIACALCNAWSAQHDPFDEQMSSIILLQSKVVQRELGITAQQRAAMNKYADAHRVKLNAYYKQAQSKGSQSGQLSVDENRLQGMFATLKRGVLSQMSAAQVRRLREISLQTLDFTGLADPLLAAKLGISSATRAKINRLVGSGMAEANQVRYNAINKATADLTRQHPNSDREKQRLLDEANRRAESAAEEINPQVMLIKADTKKKVLALLTQQQKAKWHALMGTPFRG